MKTTVPGPKVIIPKLPFGWLKGINLKGRYFNGWFFIKGFKNLNYDTVGV